MALAVEREWDGPLEGLVVTPYGQAAPCERIERRRGRAPGARRGRPCRRGAHPASWPRGSRPDDLHALPHLGRRLRAARAAGGRRLALEDMRAVNAALLRCGATIAEMNCVRKHLSAVKGGRLAEAAHPARVVTYLISDVPGDDPAVIASGPTVPDPTTFAEALEVLRRYGIDVPPSVTATCRPEPRRARACRSAARGAPRETPKPGDPAFAADEIVMLATARDALEAAAAARRGRRPRPPRPRRRPRGRGARPRRRARRARRGLRARRRAARSSGLREAVARGAAHLAGSALTAAAARRSSCSRAERPP